MTLYIQVENVSTADAIRICDEAQKIIDRANLERATNNDIFTTTMKFCLDEKESESNVEPTETTTFSRYMMKKEDTHV